MSTPLTDTISAVSKAVGQSDFEGANALAAKAVAEGAAHPALFNAQALWNERQGRDAQAASYFRRARDLAPDNHLTLEALGLCLARLGEFDEAIASLKKSTSLRPERAASHFRLGHVLWQAGMLPEAETALRQALARDAQMPEALSCMAAVVAARGDMATANNFARRCLQVSPSDPLARTVAAAAHLNSGSAADAEKQLSTIVDLPGLNLQARLLALALLGRAQMALGRDADSFTTYSKRNALITPEKLSSETLLVRLQDQDAFLAGAGQPFWQPAPTDGHPEPNAGVHVFIAAFPRSGAEVLAQMLGRHPGVCLLQDCDPLFRASEHYLSGQAALSELAAIDAPCAMAEQSGYWDAVRRSRTNPSAAVLIDASPMNAFRLPLIAKLFPKAKVVVLQRDPRDVITSCWMQMPRIADALGYPGDLETLAHEFDLVARAVSTARDRMLLPVTAANYETLTADSEATLGPVCEFLDLEWSTAHFARPTATEDGLDYPLETSGMWRKWMDQISSLLPLLQPWIDEGGYE